MFWEYADWPPAWCRAALSRPWRILTLAQSDGVIRAQPQDFTPLTRHDKTAPDLLFPKLGAKSWRDGPGLQPLARDATLPVRLVRVLARPTGVQQELIAEMVRQGAPLRLYLMPWRDMTAWSEARLHVTKNDTRITSFALRTPEPSGDWKQELILLANALANATEGSKPLDIDLAFAPGQSPRLIEVNPVGLWRLSDRPDRAGP